MGFYCFWGDCMKRCDLCGKKIWWWNELKITLRTSPFEEITHIIHDYHLKEGISIGSETGIQKKEKAQDVQLGDKRQDS